MIDVFLGGGGSRIRVESVRGRMRGVEGIGFVFVVPFNGIAIPRPTCKLGVYVYVYRWAESVLQHRVNVRLIYTTEVRVYDMRIRMRIRMRWSCF